jgi:fructan beta-fructosidase
MKKLPLAAALLLLTQAGMAQTAEKYRPSFHFAPEKNWTNDPNGLVYLDGEYHIFYQYNPFGDTWGHMSWGHAVSKDLTHWEHLPLALPEFPNPDGKSETMIFSGSAVVDAGNKSGLCPSGTKDCLVAIYTGHIHAKGEELLQQQNLAFSADKGRTWQQYSGNPVLTLNTPTFRDPNVSWYEPEKKWVMAVAKPDKHQIYFYESPDLKKWNKTGEFGPQGDITKIWECPALFKAPVINEKGKEKWVLLVSSGHRTPGYVGMQYFVGEFDGKTFRADKDNPNPGSPAFGNVLDWGKDFYAAIEFNHRPKSRPKPLILGWALNWEYAGKVPTSPFRGSMTLAREVSLKRTPGGLVLVQEPVLTGVRQETVEKLASVSLKDETKALPKATGDKLDISFTVDPAGGEAGLVLDKNGEQETILRVKSGSVELDRRHSGNVSFHKAFPSADAAPVGKGPVSVRVVRDASLLEIYLNGGEAVLTEHIFPEKPGEPVSLFGKGGKAVFKNVVVKQLR